MKCRFWDNINGTEKGNCLRHAPRPDSLRDSFEAYWPITAMKQWCGEHEPVEEKERVDNE